MNGEERVVRNALKALEKSIPHSCRYKEWDVDGHSEMVIWVTQESTLEESKLVANKIKGILENMMAYGDLPPAQWTIRVTVRDLYSGAKTRWHADVVTCSPLEFAC